MCKAPSKNQHKQVKSGVSIDCKYMQVVSHFGDGDRASKIHACACEISKRHDASPRGKRFFACTRVYFDFAMRNPQRAEKPTETLCRQARTVLR